jgi:hypothetical protein
MQSTIKYRFFFPAIAVALALAGRPQQVVAQRFSHPAPSFHPAPAPAYHPAPAARPAQPARSETRPAQPARPEEVRPTVEPRPTINGGARNVGVHDYSHPVDVHQNVNVQRAANVHENVNVYHTGGYRGIHPYYYHPYRPYYWGPHWHPLGFFLTALAADAIWFDFNGQRYWYDDGCYYLPSNGGYSVVPAPIGALVSMLPPGYETTQVGDQTYYYFGGVFYVSTGQGYQVVAAPPDAVITQLPTGAVEQDENGQTLMVYNNTYYLPITQDGQDAYEVVTP